jgi:hypothetical protein
VGLGKPNYSKTLIQKTSKTAPDETLCDFKSLAGFSDLYD